MDRGEIIIYQTPDGSTNLDVQLENETIWMTQAQMVMLLGRDQSVISKHISNIFKEKELDKIQYMQNLHILPLMANRMMYGILYKSNGSRLIENNTLVALTLIIAESRTEEKDMMLKVVVNLINRNN